ncbi:hypothetical protein SeLEV6574_g02295 [Synchytrium endobioticum]|uniref:RNA-polymerase II-associated protein 3-like C-terminal domain-containing protein n=1 Tax=Synchytrium endobioticum TaxID=286115 RepID=A0A507DB34_9FUNG|nr:hypothetical protein SeLEV6574_g02295 [Synchytrium endobioticum]
MNSTRPSDIMHLMPRAVATYTDSRRPLPGLPIPDLYDVEHLDFGYVAQCPDANELVDLYAVLKSGKEGIWEHLESAVLARIRLLDPQRHARLAPATTQPAQCDLRAWTTELLELDASVSRPSCPPPSLPPIRSTLSIILPSTPPPTNPPASPPPALPTTVPVPLHSTAPELVRLADLEKLKGNECLKCGDVDDAIAYYTRSLAVLPRAHVYTNRSLAHFTKKEYARAEDDATAALALGPDGALKAYLRRGHARTSRGKYRDAHADFAAALVLDPCCRAALAGRDLAARKHRAVAGEHAPALDTAPRRMSIEEVDNDPDTANHEEIVARDGERGCPTFSANVPAKAERYDSGVSVDAAISDAKRDDERYVTTVGVPVTDYEFESVWSTLRYDRVQLAAWLFGIPPASLPGLLGPLDEGTLAAVLVDTMAVLRAQCSVQPTKVWEYIKWLKQLPNVKDVLLENAEWATFESLKLTFDTLNRHLEQGTAGGFGAVRPSFEDIKEVKRFFLS